ncbi:phenylacetate--CoA ligase, partial [Synergistaceae bacterium OttesenSCG-928-D05]|nr:phenylacetate--CoA ligase [Synergistaceae bacterium OttesenSCG-928-D05]
MNELSIMSQCFAQVRRVAKASPMYREKYKDIPVEKMMTKEQFESLPFTSKQDLRDAYPMGMLAVPDEEVVRVHSSSGTTGIPVVLPYSRQDVEDWAVMMERCYQFAGITRSDRIQVTPGFGLWTAGLGFQAGAERLGAMVIPTGSGNTDRQLQLMRDLNASVLIGTSSYGLLLAEEVDRRDMRDDIHLKKGIFGSERWGDKVRQRIYETLGIEFFDIYGLTEIYGPGIAMDCSEHSGMHYFTDYIYCEIINPETGQVLPEGEEGELVITTYRKEAAPLIRFRTRDITRVIPGTCACGSPFPRLDRIVGRSDDMIKVKGTNIYPAQIEEILKKIDGFGSEYRIILENEDLRDRMVVQAEADMESDFEELAYELERAAKSGLGIRIIPE